MLIEVYIVSFVYLYVCNMYILIYYTYIGTVHHDDLLYLFVAPSVAPMFTLTDPENIQVERMTKMWTNFATRRYIHIA